MLNVAVDTSDDEFIDTSLTTKSQTVFILFTLELVAKEWKQPFDIHSR